MTTRFYGFGINDYPGQQNDLRGCVNDTILMRRSMMYGLNIPRDYVHLRFDNRATLNAYREKMNHSLEHSKPGDTVIFHSSSHGTQVFDRNGDELNDFMDEAIVPSDFETAGLLLDDEFGEWLRSFKDDITVIVFLDSCFSGTMSRSSYPLETIKVKTGVENNKTVRNRRLELPLDMQARGEDFLREKRPTESEFAFRRSVENKTKVNKRKFVERQTSDSVILFTGCAEEETSADAYFSEAGGGHGAYQGAFTWSVCKILHESDFNVTYGELAEKSGLWLKSQGFGQTPWLECAEELKNKRFGKGLS